MNDNSEEPHVSSTLRWQDVSLPSAVTDTDLDTMILSIIERNWRKTAFVIGRVARRYEDRTIQLSYEIIGARIQELAAHGRIESQGNLSMWRHSEVRLPASC
jgi:hypothetical protein